MSTTCGDGRIGGGMHGCRWKGGGLMCPIWIVPVGTVRLEIGGGTVVEPHSENTDAARLSFAFRQSQG